MQPGAVEPPAVPPGFVIGALTEEDGVLVNDTWAYGKSAETLAG
jgi:hypothetical protein